VPRPARSLIATILMGAYALAASLALAANAPASSAPAASAAAGSVAAPPAPMSAAEVIQMLDETVDWYRTLGAQQQIADEPGDLLIVSENRQIANQVAGLAFDVARVSADQLVESATSAASGNRGNDSAQTLAARQHKLDAQVLSVQQEIDSTRAQLAGAPKKAEQALQAKVAELQGELDLLNAKKSMLGSLVTAVNGSDATDVSSLRSQIDAMAVALPGTTTGAPQPAAGTAAQHPPGTAASSTVAATSRFGVWNEAADVFKLSERASSIDAIDRRTDALQSALLQIQNKLVAQLRALSARGDALMTRADSADSAALGVTRDELDTLASQFKQASILFVPLKKQAALLDQYRRNLKNWRDAVKVQSRRALGSLGIRVGVLGLILGAVFALAELWHRGVLKYVQDARRRYQLLLLRKIALWTLVVIIIGFTFASELGSILTFAGLITAGLAVAMQSVLVSIVGYFFLIGKYGIRIGDRVQIGEVSGEIIELGMVRMYLMELASRGSLVPTGRVAAFPNSVVFQVTTGLFKQIPGVSFAWHDITLALPPGVDYATTKEKLFAAANETLAEYREEIQRQTRELQRTTLSSAGGDTMPTVQLSYSVKGVDAHVRYPVHLPHAAEIDERMSQALLHVISALTPKGSGEALPSA